MGNFATVVIPRLAVAIGVFVGPFCSVAYAYEGNLILPEERGSNLRFDLHKEQSGIYPTDILQVFVGKRDECCEGKSAVAGRYLIDNRGVTFTPAFDFIEGQHYTVKIPGKEFEEFTLKRSVDTVKPEIVAVYPSGPDIPENTLRFYIHFSTPMKPHVSSDYIKLQGKNGKTDTAAFMSFKQELWSEDRKRLTLLMDPGRIKRGVEQNQTLGPAFQEGGTYSLVIEEGWPAANNTEKLPWVENVFTVSKALRTLPDPDRWKITAPSILTNEPLFIVFDRPFDHALLLSGISVVDEDGIAIPGAVSIESNERRWRFDPKVVWRNARIQIAIDPLLEDVAGNNLMELLDHSLGAEESKSILRVITVDLDSSLI